MSGDDGFDCEKNCIRGWMYFGADPDSENKREAGMTALEYIRLLIDHSTAIPIPAMALEEIAVWWAWGMR